MLTDDEVEGAYQLLTDTLTLMRAMQALVALKPAGVITVEDARAMLSPVRSRLTGEIADHVDRYCEAVGEWIVDRDKEVIAERCFNAVATEWTFARAQLIHRGIDWRELTRKEVPTRNALF